MKNLQDRVAIVTGASRGLGTYIAKELAGAGCHLVLAARTAPALESLAEEIRGMGRRALAVACDVADADSRRSLVSRGAGGVRADRHPREQRGHRGDGALRGPGR
ncbi:SDR family NAD(P)-dependent oxidoreductase [Tepidiforma flava]|uniref:SDR family NAD(P)-dependent oxidoreductase n=1 Tax=Tepidiforma flava TaxID=3004094 RepID=UPI0035716115